MDGNSILLVWTTSMLFLMWRTNSLRTSLATTTIVVTMFLMSVINVVFGVAPCLFIMVAVISVLVARVIPHDTIDTWRKGKECC